MKNNSCRNRVFLSENLRSAPKTRLLQVGGWSTAAILVVQCECPRVGFHFVDVADPLFGSDAAILAGPV